MSEQRREGKKKGRRRVMVPEDRSGTYPKVALNEEEVEKRKSEGRKDPEMDQIPAAAAPLWIFTSPLPGGGWICGG